MAEVPNRAKIEAELARTLSRLGKKRLTEIVDAAMANNGVVPPDVWAKAEAELRLAVRPALEDVHRNQDNQMSARVDSGINWNQTNTAAQQWAATYSFELVRGIVDYERGVVNTQAQQVLRDAIAAGFDAGTTQRMIRDALEPTFGPVRAEMIAVTEVTRAAVQGQEATIARLRARGIRMSAFWITEKDGRVCPVCQPRQGKKQGDGWTDLPPAHPRCRCDVRYELDA